MAKLELSIIMPSYNVAALIPKAIDSVLQQTFDNWELIVVDDGSIDNLEDVVRPYTFKDSRIKLVSKLNGGLSDARNFGLSHAKGSYIHFFDPDDYLKDYSWYESVFNNIYGSSNIIDLIITGYFVEEEKVYETVRITERPLCIPFEGKYGEKCIQHVCYAWNKFFRRDFLTNNKLLFEKGLSRIEDAEFMSRLVQCKPKYQYISNGGYVYVQRKEPTLSKGFDANQIEISERRINMDKILIQYFNGILSSHINLNNYLRTDALVSTLNRLYLSIKDLSPESTHDILESAKRLLPHRFTPVRKSPIKTVYDYLLYWSLKNSKYGLIDLIQKMRLRKLL